MSDLPEPRLSHIKPLRRADGLVAGWCFRLTYPDADPEVTAFDELTITAPPEPLEAWTQSRLTYVLDRAVTDHPLAVKLRRIYRERASLRGARADATFDPSSLRKE